MRKKLLFIMAVVVFSMLAASPAAARRKVVYMLNPSVKKAVGISLDELRSKSASSIALETAKGKVEVFLYSENEQVETVKKQSCGEATGDKKRQGNYMLISVKDKLVTSKIILGGNYFFIEGLFTHWLNDGLRTFPRVGGGVFAIYQHLGCTLKSMEFFMLDKESAVIKVPFKDKDGLEFIKIFTGFKGETGHYKGAHVFCSTSAAIKHTICLAYDLRGQEFAQARTWMIPSSKRTDRSSSGVVEKDPLPPYSVQGEARHTLFSYLMALSKGDYRRAAHYYGGSYSRLRRMNPTLNTVRYKPAGHQYLKRYCTANRGKCYIPTSVKSNTFGRSVKGMDSGLLKALGKIDKSDGTMKFSVEFVSPGYKKLEIDGKKKFTFRVLKTSKGFKVLDLPPRKRR